MCLETSVISFLAALPSLDLLMAAQQQVTHELWRHRREHFDLSASPFAVNESAAGDEEAARQASAPPRTHSLLKLSARSLRDD